MKNGSTVQSVRLRPKADPNKYPKADNRDSVSRRTILRRCSQHDTQHRHDDDNCSGASPAQNPRTGLWRCTGLWLLRRRGHPTAARSLLGSRRRVCVARCCCGGCAGGNVADGGDFYVYARRAFGDRGGFVIGWSDWINWVSALAYQAITAAAFLSALWAPAAAHNQAVALSILSIFTGLHWVGLRLGRAVTGGISPMLSSCGAEL
jgi:Amino acid permease